MTIQHVPFGLRIEDHSFVDVCDVARGKKCDCICPSCHTPLIARQGEEKQWHFAHATRKVDKTDKECDFSFFVSVRMMARQVIETGIRIALPEYKCTVARQAKGTHFKEEFLVAKQTTIELKDVHKEAAFSNCVVDIVGKVQAFSFVIYFTHPNRPLPASLHVSDNQQSGVLEIKLDDTHHLFKENRAGTRQLDRLKLFLQNDLSSKSWVFHPRKASIQKAAYQRLNSTIASYQVNRHSTTSHSSHGSRVSYQHNDPWLAPRNKPTAPPSPFPKRTATFECIMCNCQWQASLPGQPTCPKCHNHLYASEVSSR
ncbi:competence protein CoiA [Vibrio sp. 10N.286.49.C2]|uniref:competence protein CoiA family protein n=1 Tax=Vibrio TaxID=662 RepID=UPI00080D9467|nr:MULTISPECIES: competence protein CoiA family protein [Vibrio]MDR9830017.1 competence protein CoiA family protein [Vibrio sp. FNV 38]OCH65127.1 competence protein CoiA [Vibrio splendidus]PMH30924.1 competence protein CoiA [Vibrio sp. 10N.286.49.C2]PMH48138.1 competence protein CoiA [Vibrio sp. 10N.286.49.B1]